MAILKTNSGLRFSDARIEQAIAAVESCGSAGANSHEVGEKLGMWHKTAASICRLIASQGKLQHVQRGKFGPGERVRFYAVGIVPDNAPAPKVKMQAPKPVAKPEPKPKPVPKPKATTLAAAGAVIVQDTHRTQTTAHQRFLSAEPTITKATKVTVCPTYRDTRYAVDAPTPVFSRLRPGQYPVATGSVIERAYWSGK